MSMLAKRSYKISDFVGIFFHKFSIIVSYIFKFHAGVQNKMCPWWCTDTMLNLSCIHIGPLMYKQQSQKWSTQVLVPTLHLIRDTQLTINKPPFIIFSVIYDGLCVSMAWLHTSESQQMQYVFGYFFKNSAYHTYCLLVVLFLCCTW